MFLPNRTPDEVFTIMIELADLAYGDAPCKDIEIAHKHVLDVISKNKAGFHPITSRWLIFPTMLANALSVATATAFSR